MPRGRGGNMRGGRGAPRGRGGGSRGGNPNFTRAGIRGRG